MSSRYAIQSNEGGVSTLADYSGRGLLHVASRYPPVNGAIGYAPSCIWNQMVGGGSTPLAVNIGDNGLGKNAPALWYILNTQVGGFFPGGSPVSTVVTRSIGLLANKQLDQFDRVAIKTDVETYNPPAATPKWGIIKVHITTVAWTTTLAGAPHTAFTGTLDLRPPNFNEDNDTPILDHFVMSVDQGSTSPGVDYFFAVNNGVVGPSAVVQGDNTVDLLWLTVRLTQVPVATALTVTVTYTLTFTDLTPAAVSVANNTLTLHTNVIKPATVGGITLPTSTFGTSNGYVTFAMVSLTTTGIDVPTDLNYKLAQSANQDYGAQQRDGVPQLAVQFCGSGQNLLGHPVTKWSGLKSYPLRSFAVFALNGGKLDANALNQQVAGGNQVCFFNVLLNSPPTCNDDVTCALGYCYTLTTV